MSSVSNKTALAAKIRKLAYQNAVAEHFLKRLICHVAILQIIQNSKLSALHNWYIKGGTGIAVSGQIAQVRFTRDLDISLNIAKTELDQAVQELDGLFWNDFSIQRVKAVSTGNPKGIPDEYRIQRYELQLFFKQSQWITAILEASISEFDNEVPVAHEAISNDLIEIFESIGLGTPDPVRIISPELQIAQKIHAVTLPGSDRGHDLYDIAILLETNSINVEVLSELVRRTFGFRNTHELENELDVTQVLEATYVSAVMDLSSAPKFSNAVEIFNKLIHSLLLK